jgi:hypothetical protein
VALLVVFIWQLVNINTMRTAMKDTIGHQTQLVEQSKQVQGSLEKLVVDLLELARGNDPDAQAIVKKYNIQQGAPAAPAASPAS